MRFKKILFPALLAGAGLALVRRVVARPVPAILLSNGDATDAVAAYEAIDAYVEEQMQRLNMPGVSLAIVEGDRIVHLRGFGRARPGGEAPTPHTPFFLCSLTKSFSALAIMQLVEAGKLDLDVPVQRYLPWFRVGDPQASAQMTIRHLLYQTSGLPTSSGEYILSDFDDSPGATERQVRALSTLVLTRPVGSAFEYSNSNYQILGLVIAAASGESYADYLQKHILTPLGMSRTYTSPTEAKENGLAVGHQYWFAMPFAAPDMPIPHGSLPGGGLISSSEDMARYLIAHLNGGRYGDAHILSGAGIDELHRRAADVIVFGRSMGGYAMGWFVDTIGGAKLVWHDGVLPHFGAFMALLPEQKKGVVLLFNAENHWIKLNLINFGMGVTALLAGEKHTPIPFSGLIPWILRGQLLIPALQIAGVAGTLRLLRRWRLDPTSRPDGRRKWGLAILLPLIPNLLLASTLIPMLGKRRGYLKLYMPDYSWIVRVCGSFALAWSFLRTGLVLRALRRPSPPQT